MKMKVKIIPAPLHLVVTLCCDEQMRVRIRKGANDGLGFGSKELFFLKLVFLCLWVCFHRWQLMIKIRIRKGANDGLGFGNKGIFRDLRLSLTPICPYKENQWSFSHSFLVLYFVSQ